MPRVPEIRERVTREVELALSTPVEAKDMYYLLHEAKKRAEELGHDGLDDAFVVHVGDDEVIARIESGRASTIGGRPGSWMDVIVHGGTVEEMRMLLGRLKEEMTLGVLVRGGGLEDRVASLMGVARRLLAQIDDGPREIVP